VGEGVEKGSRTCIESSPSSPESHPQGPVAVVIGERAIPGEGMSVVLFSESERAAVERGMEEGYCAGGAVPMVTVPMQMQSIFVGAIVRYVQYVHHMYWMLILICTAQYLRI